MALAAIYCRLSQDDMIEGDSKSIINQREMLTEYAHKHNINIYDYYIDDGISGMEEQRPEFQRMLRDCEAHNIDTVLCKDQSRFSRDEMVVRKYLREQFFIWGIHYIGIADSTDNASPDFIDSSAFRAFFNEFYVRDCSRKVKATVDAKHRKGQWCHAAPYGYKKDPNDNNHLIPDPNTAPIVQRIYDDYVNGGISMVNIAKNLNAEGVPSPVAYKTTIYPNYQSKYKHNKWSSDSIRNIVGYEVYIGNTVLGRSKKVSYSSKYKKTLPPSEWIRTEGTHEPIIDKDLFNQAVNKHKSTTIRTNSNTRTAYPLAGKIKCAECGRTMARRTYVTKRGTGKYIYFGCSSATNGTGNCTHKNMYKSDKIEAIVVNEINKKIQEYINPQTINIINTNNADKYTKQMKQIDNNITSTTAKIDTLYDSLIDNIITKEEYKRLKDKYTAQIEQYQAQKEQVQQQLDQLQDTAHITTLIDKYSTGNITELSIPLVNDLIKSVAVGRLNNGTFVSVDMTI